MTDVIESLFTMLELVDGVDILDMGEKDGVYLVLCSHELLWHNQINFYPNHFDLLTLIEPTKEIANKFEERGFEIELDCKQNAYNRLVRVKGKQTDLAKEIVVLIDTLNECS